MALSFFGNPAIRRCLPDPSALRPPVTRGLPLSESSIAVKAMTVPRRSVEGVAHGPDMFATRMSLKHNEKKSPLLTKDDALGLPDRGMFAREEWTILG